MLVITAKLGRLLEKKYKVALSLPELTQQTNAFSTKHRPGCVPTLQKSNPQSLFLDYNVTCHESYSDPAGHEVRVQFDLSKVKDVPTSNDLDVAVACSCPAFLYWGAQWNLYQRESLEGQPRPLLAPPQEQLDLREHFVICKHCKAVFERILPAVQHNINKILRQEEVEEKTKQPPTPTPRSKRVRQRQQEMRTRKELEKKRKQKIRTLRRDLEEGVKKRDEERNLGLVQSPAAVTRTEPSTQELKDVEKDEHNLQEREVENEIQQLEKVQVPDKEEKQKPPPKPEDEGLLKKLWNKFVEAPEDLVEGEKKKLFQQRRPKR